MFFVEGGLPAACGGTMELPMATLSDANRVAADANDDHDHTGDDDGHDHDHDHDDTA